MLVINLDVGLLPAAIAVKQKAVVYREIAGYKKIHSL